MSEEELKPCPFCGGSPEIISDKSNESHYISCLDCRASTMYSYKIDIIKAWNTRAKTQKQKECDHSYESNLKWYSWKNLGYSFCPDCGLELGGEG